MITTINIDLVREFAGRLGQIGRTARGGITRLSYSPEFRQGQSLTAEYMKGAGMETVFDPFGNLVGTYRGLDPSLPAVLTGSHLDTVPEGGEFDGALGVAAAIECVHAWAKAGWRPKRTVKVIATVEEEGSTFGVGCLGSRVIAGEFRGRQSKELKDTTGRTLAWHLKNCGLDENAFNSAVVDPATIGCFIELHVEQGADLDLSDIPCGLVTDIVGIDRHWVTILGEANHAGTTRMERRRDAMVAAAEVVSGMYRKAIASSGRYVATIGKLEVTPGAANVIPGRIDFVVETRAATGSAIEEARNALLECLHHIEATHQVRTEVTKRHLTDPVHLDERLLGELRVAAAETEVRFIEMPSWAGHDAKIFANIVPTAMVFAPSTGGISHSPAESSPWSQVAKAVEVLNQALRRLASA